MTDQIQDGQQPRKISGKKTSKVKGEPRASWMGEKKSAERGKVMTIILGVGQSASGVRCQRLLFIWGGQGANVCAGASNSPQIASPGLAESKAPRAN